MSALAPFLEHWGYGGLCAVVVLGNVGVPIPEEAVLTLSGYLVWRGDFELWLVLVVGIMSASAGDAVGYWLGRRFGGQALRRYGRRVWLTPEKLDATDASCRSSARSPSSAPVPARAALRRRALRGYHRDSRLGLLHRECARRLCLCAADGRDRICGWPRRRIRLERARTSVVGVEHVVLAAVVALTLFALLVRWRRRRLVTSVHPAS